MPPDNEQRPLSGAPSAGLDQSLELGTENIRRVIPVDGGGPCDRCGWRTWRHTPAGWRHEPCEPSGYWIRKAMLRAHAYGRAPQFHEPRPTPLCAGCCVCRGRR